PFLHSERDVFHPIGDRNLTEVTERIPGASIIQPEDVLATRSEGNGQRSKRELRARVVRKQGRTNDREYAAIAAGRQMVVREKLLVTWSKEKCFGHGVGSSKGSTGIWISSTTSCTGTSSRSQRKRLRRIECRLATRCQARRNLPSSSGSCSVATTCSMSTQEALSLTA